MNEVWTLFATVGVAIMFANDPFYRLILGMLIFGLAASHRFGLI